MRGSEWLPKVSRTLAVVIGLTACQPQPQPVFTEGVRFARLDTLLAYSRAQVFVPELGDSQRLMLGSYPTGTYGPRVQVSPHIRSHAHERAELHRETLLARLVNFDSLAYPKLNLAPFDTVYIWTTTGSGDIGGPPNILYISSRTGQRLEVGMRFHPGPGFRLSQPAARFAWRDDDEKVCIACEWTAWCITDE